jgi:hypothetical protein
MGPEQALPNRRATPSCTPSQWGGHMRVGCEKNFVMERACEDLNGQVPVSLADDIGCAARSHVPVLITGAPDQSREIAFAIDRRSQTTHGSVDVIDCQGHQPPVLVERRQRGHARLHSAVTGGTCAQPARTGSVRAPAGGVARIAAEQRAADHGVFLSSAFRPCARRIVRRTPLLPAQCDSHGGRLMGQGLQRVAF